MLASLSPRKTGNGTETEQQKPSERPHYIHMANPFQNVQAPDALRSPSKVRYSRDALCDVFQSTTVTPPDSVAMRQFDIFTDQLLKPLMLCQSSAEEQMACLLLSNGTWTPSGVPAPQGPPGRGPATTGGSGLVPNDGGGPAGMGGNNYRMQGQRGRGLAMQQRRFQQRPLESDRVDNWRQRPGPGVAPPPGVGLPASFPSNNQIPSPTEGPDANNSQQQQLWQSRQAESRLAPNWLMGSNSQSTQPTNVQSPEGGAVPPFQEPSPGSFSASAPKPNNLESLAQSDAGKMFAEDIAPYWTSGKSTQQQQQQQPQQQSAPAPVPDPQPSPQPQQAQVAKSPAPTPPAIIDGESLWNTLSAHDLQPPQQQQKPKTLSPISSDPAVVLARKAVPTPEPAQPPPPSSPEPPKPIVLEQEQDQQAWFYVDPSGTLQGPFSGQQMEEWDNEGYFPDDLRLRPAVLGQNSAPTDERGFITLSKLRSSAVLSGRSPFLACNISPRQLTPREIVEQRAEQQHQAVQQQPEPLLVQQLQQTQQQLLQQQQQTIVQEEPPKVVQQQQHHHHHHTPQQQEAPPDIRRQSWGSSLSSISSDADIPITKPAVSRIAIALTSDVANREPEPLGWGEEPEPFEPEPEPERSKSAGKATTGGQAQTRIQQQQQEKGAKSRRRKKSTNKPADREKEQPVDPLLNAEPAEVRRARLAAEQLRIAEENSRKLEDRDAMLAVLEEKRILREKEREMERRIAAASAPKPAVPRAPQGPPALPATAKWAMAAKPGSKPAASLLEIQRQEAAAEASERAEEEQRRNLSMAIAASTQQVQQTNWGAVPVSNSASSASWSAFPEPPSKGRKPQQQFGGGGFWDEGDDDGVGPEPQQGPNRPAPRLSNILGSSGASAHPGKTGTKQKDSKPSLAPEMSVLASWVVSELSRRYSAATSLSPDIVPAFARLLGTIDEISGQDELMQRAAPYFYRQEDARVFVSDFIAARTRLQQNPSLMQAATAPSPSKASKSNQPQQPPARSQSQPQHQQQQEQSKSKAKKKPIPVQASALFKLVGPPPPAPQLDE